jgi:hypothetical protein
MGQQKTRFLLKEAGFKTSPDFSGLLFGVSDGT